MHRLLEDSVCVDHLRAYMVEEEPHLPLHLPLLQPNCDMLVELPSIAPPLPRELSCLHTWGVMPNNPATP